MPRRKVMAAGAAGVAIVGAIVTSAALNAVAFVGADDDGRVAMFRGVPYALPLGVELWRLEYRSGVPLSSLPVDVRRGVVEHDLQTPDEAAADVRRIELTGPEG